MCNGFYFLTGVAMRKIFTGAVLAAMALGITILAGCGSSITQKTPQAPQAAAATFKNSALLAGRAELAASLDAANQVIIDVRSSSAYSTSGHIRNAVNLTPATFDKGGAGLDSTDLKTPAEIATILGNAGITATTKIIVYGQNVDANAGRLFWLLEHMGAKNVQLLDGGMDKWVSDGYPTVTTATAVTPDSFVPALDGSKLATKAVVLANYLNADVAIVDSRDATDATGLKTGSNLPYDAKHIPNAVNITIGDFLNADKTVKSSADIQAFLDGKGITQGKSVITHCYVGYRSGQEYFIFRLMGYDVSNYDGSWAEWNADAALPTASRINGNLLTGGATLEAAIDRPNQVIIDVRSAADYALGHIKNAVNLTPGSFDKGGAGLDSTDLKTPADIALFLGANGVSNPSRIVVYGKAVDANAGRVFWLLEYLGAKDVHVLDGGYDKWLSDGRATVTTPTAVAAVTFSAVPDNAKLATKAEVLARYADTANYAVVDSRNASDYATKHITNAINILIGDFLNPDGTVKSYADLKTLLDGKGITAVKKVMTHCYVGYRSGQEYFMLRLMGFDVSNYDGSWTEWSADPSLPTAP
jgi:thiosulfate/3-mercaptopyruvate sulfurtransferase